jgi:Ca2+-binding RTX toxin-like protein
MTAAGFSISPYDLYERSGGQTTLLTPSPGDPVERGVQFMGASTDGTKAVFVTSESLTDDDDDDTLLDVYLSEGGALTLVTPQVDDGLGNESTYSGMSADGSVVVFLSNHRLADSDDDDVYDLYASTDGVVTHVSVGPDGGSDGTFPEFARVSRDGSRVLFSTTESLTSEDGDSLNDVYLRTPGGLVLVTAGTAADAFLEGANPDLTTVLISTTSPLLPGDGEADNDLYAWNAGTFTLVSTGPLDTGGELGVDGEFVSEDGSRILFTAESTLTPDDTDGGEEDLYERSGGTTTLLTPGTVDEELGQLTVTADASRVFFETDEALTSADLDASRDTYESVAGSVSQITHSNAEIPAFLRGVAADGLDVFWTTDEPVMGDDLDLQQDVYASRVGPPGNIGSPIITGEPRPGQTLTCAPGTWFETATFAYQWNRDGEPVGDATEATYAVTGADLDTELTCTVTATGDRGVGSATSVGVTVTAGGPPPECANEIDGTPGPDILQGTEAEDRMHGFAGGDVLSGLQGDDCLFGGRGNDRVLGNVGDDVLVGGRGADVVRGSGGDDVIRGSRGPDALKGGDDRDLVVGGSGADVLDGGRGDDRLLARDGVRDIVRCGGGRDQVTADRRDKLVGCEVRSVR